VRQTTPEDSSDGAKEKEFHGHRGTPTTGVQSQTIGEKPHKDKERAESPLSILRPFSFKGVKNSTQKRASVMKLIISTSSEGEKRGERKGTPAGTGRVPCVLPYTILSFCLISASIGCGGGKGGKRRPSDACNRRQLIRFCQLKIPTASSAGSPGAFNPST